MYGLRASSVQCRPVKEQKLRHLSAEGSGMNERDRWRTAARDASDSEANRKRETASQQPLRLSSSTGPQQDARSRYQFAKCSPEMKRPPQPAAF